MAFFQKDPKLYISSLNLSGLKGSGVKTSINVRGGILTQVPKLSFSVAHVAPFYSILLDLE